MSKISEKQLQAVRLLTSGLSVPEVASQLKVSQRTVYRWSKSSQFANLVSEIQTEAIDKVIEKSSEEMSERLKSMLPDALDVLHDFIKDDNKRGSDRLAAIRILGQWSGLGNNQQIKGPTEPQVSLKDYLSLLNNGNGKSTN